ncbi:Oidioi.mRNA.OKI2018_I69.chr2.g7233.t1.cds [Oikopleura dioica]|uniref:Oidioi.mRNA.OKI2018_I69.chr2.g7233.t1.cds n=1 Tax=Oikopleura dioica TaxID=34765 RepID=A0ABN7TC74_OIKDI|nr:Oidioi.mRNA.OKI2018_I69.chr2.g7233.t1.cds [Oikopleura dioica]
MAETYWPKFDDKKLWSYGCNGFNRGDRPMSSPGNGLPVDQLDKLYHTYKACLMCARRVHSPANSNGDECIGEIVKYDAEKTPRNQWKCNDQPGSCPRLLCECDLMFAQNIGDAMEFYDKSKKHGKNKFDPEQDCIRSANGGDLRCCGAPDQAMATYNANNKQCCKGEILNVGDFC